MIALPVAALFEWLRTGRVRWRWIALWAAIFAAYAVVEIVSHERNQGGAPPRDDAPAVWLRTVVAIAMRYLVMAATSLGCLRLPRDRARAQPARSLVPGGSGRARGPRLASGRRAEAAQPGGRLLDLGAGRLRAGLPGLPVPLPDGGPLPLLHASRADRRRALRGARRGAAASRAAAAGRRHRRGPAGRGAGRVLRRAQRRAGGDLALGDEPGRRRRRALSGGRLGEPPAREARRADRRRRGGRRPRCGRPPSAATPCSSRSRPIPPSPACATIRSSAPSSPRSLPAGSSEGARARTRRSRSSR